ncbi:hypothetical protein R3W88_023864 [Solanum pinnatisectum]|uniref:Reverse transcriptase zinc-binding domain-containing protein n=1 Tax=Solanum pinnatisectum TaxID=50273 RepID=A0AAV9LYQ8_9SOLN|nr:hypothetical protein R3W88_023864 [Solanum pinnatisectum]
MNKLTVLQWQSLIEKITTKISSWIARKLLYAGRTQLIQTVLFGIQSYWAQLFLIPTKVVKVIDGICRSYLWSGEGQITKKALVAWERTSWPKSVGGMRLPNIRLWNQAAVAKMCWDLANKADKLWITSWITRKIMGEKNIVDRTQQCNSRKGSLIRQIYLSLIGDQPKVAWKCFVFKNGATPKAQFIMWLMWVQQQTFSASDCTQFLQWSIQHGKGKSQKAQIFKIILAEYVYGLWMERNNRVFVKRSRQVKSMAKELANIIIVRAQPSIRNILLSYKY